jgi:hypothetical protein
MTSFCDWSAEKLREEDKAYSPAADNQCAGATPLTSFPHKSRSGDAHILP